MPEKILIIKTGALGDIIISIPYFLTIKRNFSDNPIFFLTKKRFNGVMENFNIFEKIYYLENSFLKDFKKLISLRKEKFDLIFDLQGNLKTNFYSFLIKGKKRIGIYEKPIGKIFLNKGIPKKKNLCPEEYRKYFFKKLGIKDIVIHEVKIDAEKEREFKKFLKKMGLEEKKYVTIHPFASPEWKTKMWFPERFAELADILIEKGYRVIFIGKGDDTDKITGYMRKKAIDLTNKTDFLTLCLLIKYSKFLITTDSAPLHIGTLFKTPTIALFGPTDPERHASSDTIVIYKNVDCSPCYRKNCNNMACMKEIKVEDVLRAIFEKK